MANIQDAAQQVKQALDRINQVKDDPQQMQQAINDAKTKVDQLVQQSQQQQK